VKKRILGLSIAAAVVISLVASGTWALFTDTEGPAPVSFTAGTVDIAVDGENPWQSFEIVIDGAKPCQVKYLEFDITNVGHNPVVVYKHLMTELGVDPSPEPKTTTGILAYPDLTSGPFSSEPESVAAGGDIQNDFNDLHNWMWYDLYSEVTLGVDGTPPTQGGGTGWHQMEYNENVKITGLWCQLVPLGTIMPGGKMHVIQSYHLDEAVGNIYQGDSLTFYFEFFAQQLEGTQVVLEDKTDASGVSIVDFPSATKGLLDYNSEGPTFDYTFKAFDLEASTDYSLIYYADPWPGDNPGALIGTFTSDGSGDIASTSGSVNLNMDLPAAADDNAPQGAKVWLVPSIRYNASTNSVLVWAEDEFLFETHAIKYHDTNITP